MKEIKIPIRIEDLAPVSSWLITLVKNNQTDFADYSPEFNTNYITDIEGKIAAVNLLVSTNVYIGEQVMATRKLNANMIAARPYLLKLEGYVKRSSDKLSVPAKTFDFPAIRKCINGSDAEGFQIKLTTLLQLTDGNKLALQDKGMKPDLKQSLDDILSQNSLLAQEQNDKMLLKAKVVKENSSMFADLWKECQNMMDAGKRIYQYTKPEMVKNFTKTYILKTMRNDGSHTANSCSNAGAETV